MDSSSRIRFVALCVLQLGALATAGCGANNDEAHTPPATHVTSAEQRALPTEQLSLGSNVCPTEWDATHLPPDEVARRQALGRRQLDALRSAYRKHPDAIVETTYASSDEGPGHEEITVRSLVRSHLDGVTEEGIDRSACFKRLATALRKLLARS